MWWLFRFLFWGCFFFLPFYRFWFCCQRMKKYKMQKVYLTYKYIPIYDTYREWQKFFLTCLQVYVLILILLQEHLTNVTPICPLMLWQSYNRRCCTSKTGNPQNVCVFEGWRSDICCLADFTIVEKRCPKWCHRQFPVFSDSCGANILSLMK